MDVDSEGGGGGGGDSSMTANARGKMRALPEVPTNVPVPVNDLLYRYDPADASIFSRNLQHGSKCS